MPGLKELTSFRANLQNIAHEEDVTSQWKERYEEYPFPENPPMPDLDVDALLGGISSPQEGAEDVATSTSAPSVNENELDTNSIDTDGFSDDYGSAFDGIDLPPPETFSMPSDLYVDPGYYADNKDDLGSTSLDLDEKDEIGFVNSDENLEDDSSRYYKSSTKKIDMDKWNADDSTSSAFESNNDGSNHILDDFLPPFDTSIEDDSNEIDFSKDRYASFDNDDSLDDLSSFDSNTYDSFSDVGNLDENNFSSVHERDDSNISDIGINDFVSSEKEPVSDDFDHGLDSFDDVSDFSIGSNLVKNDGVSIGDDNWMQDGEVSLDNIPGIDDIKNEEEIYTIDHGEDLSGGYERVIDVDMPDEFTGDLSSQDAISIDDDELETVEELPEISEDDAFSDLQNEGIENLAVENDDVSLLDDDSLESLDEDPMVDLGSFDFSPSSSNEGTSDSIDLYTEAIDEVEPSSNANISSASGIPDEFDSFANIDISQGGEETVIDEHSSFNLGENPLEENISDTMGGGFSVPDDYAQFSQEKNFSYSNKQVKDEEDNISLTISDAEYQYLIDRISSFPLNVRLEIEDYLANNDDTAISKMEFVHLIVDGANLKKIAAKLSDILDKQIQVPKGFERRSAEEYEAEKSTFKWKLRYKIIPFATVASIIIILVSCISFLTWMFVYMPIVAETIYNKGYVLLNDNKYDDAVIKFEKAGTYTKKKRWYFKYASGFRRKKQFRQAEDVYKRLLFDFSHDKQGGLNYVSMLRDDLHNYEKAENVLKRQVLDYHVNDEEALLSLGDTYLEWAREKNDKYEKARQTYSSLINMYGTKDIFLSRMMKYFIRTDKFNEVLPLKEHFVGSLNKLNLDDLTELGSYLVRKRYEDNTSDMDYLSEGIDDVREILESALKRDKENANAAYNMGKFFFYNRNLEAAESYLSKSVDMYKVSNNLSSDSLMNNVDAMRLYGEILAQNKEYLMAQEAYADALSKYQEYSENKLLAPNPTIGKLYQDYGDVNYFISGDLDKALNAYTMATKEMNDTPSIRYRIGYIQYQKKDYEGAMNSLLLVHGKKQKDKNLLYSLGNTLYKRGSYDVAQGYYERLMEILEAERIRKDGLYPHEREDHNAFIKEYMHSSNNLAVILNKLAMQSGSSEKNGRALFLFGESSRAWDKLTRNQQTLVASKAISLAYLNTQNIINPKASFEAEIYSDIPKTLEGERVLLKEVDR